MDSQAKLEDQDPKERGGPVEIKVKEEQRGRMGSLVLEVSRANREELVRLVLLVHRVTKESKATLASLVHLAFKGHLDLQDNLDNKELLGYPEIQALLVGKETQGRLEQMVKMEQTEKMVHLVLREIEASQEKMEVLESKALLGLLAHLGRRVLLVFRDTRDHQASKAMLVCLVPRVRGGTGDPQDLRGILESQDQKAPRDPQENRVIQESQDHKGPQELMEEKDQGALLAKLVGWGHRVSLGWRESQDSQVHQVPLDLLETQLLWPLQLCRVAVSRVCLEHLDQEDHRVLQEAEVPVVPEDLKEDVVHPVRMELQGVLEDRDYQEGQAVLDNQERVAFRSVCQGNIVIL